MGTLCLATDLGMGLPLEHGLQTTLIAARLAERLELDRETASQVYYAALLSHAGCTTDAHVTVEVFGSSLTETMIPAHYAPARQMIAGLLRALPDPSSPAIVRAAQTVRRAPRLIRTKDSHLSALCEVAQRLAGGLGLPGSVQELLAFLLERWDGRGPLGRAKGADIPLPMRVVHVAMDAALQRSLGGDEHAGRAVADHAGVGLDPDIAGCLVSEAQEILPGEGDASIWEATLAAEPSPVRRLEGEAIDTALEAMAGFTDLVSPYFTGHSLGVADLAADAAIACGLDEQGVVTVRRAGLLHDIGRVAVHPRIWQKAGPLTADESEQVRLHPYHTGRVLSASSFLRGLAPIADAHHERLDGSGYHRGSHGAELSTPARLLAAADVYHAMREPRPYREALGADAAAAELADEARAGRLDPHAVIAVIEAAGSTAPHIERPAGLTEREAEVIALLARGLQTKEVARELGIAVKTADRHVQNAYAKAGVSSRAAATLFAMQHGLVTWGDLPLVDTRAARG